MKKRSLGLEKLHKTLGGCDGISDNVMPFVLVHTLRGGHMKTLVQGRRAIVFGRRRCFRYCPVYSKRGVFHVELIRRRDSRDENPL